MDVIIFGVGRLAKKILSFLEKDYNIIFFVDNDKSKWETIFEGYVVKAPDEISGYTCNIIIASTVYSFEIIDQLVYMNVNMDRVYLCHHIWMNEEYDIYPVIENKLLCTGVPLIKYDLCGAKERETKCKKVLVFCFFYSVYFKQLIENISKRYADIEFSLLTCAKESIINVRSKQLKHIYCYQTMADLKSILEQLPVYDAMQLLWIEKEWAYFYQIIRTKARHLNLNVGGSDFYRADVKEREYKRKLIACADVITAETTGTIQEFKEYYKADIKEEMKLLPFGLEILELINQNRNISHSIIKNKFHIPCDKIIITCGHNAYREHRHISIIDSLARLPESLKKQIVCVFPMTYPEGQDAYICDIDNKLKETKLDYVILKDFMDFQEMAEYAIISDIMIHVQTTDQLSSTMLEEMYAGSVVIAGSWLPYHSLHEMGIFFLDVDSISDITASLLEVIQNIDEYKRRCIGNREIVWQHSSWDELAPKWHALWE